MTADSFEAADSQATADSFDAEARQLCPDGACTGLISDDGRCKLCGRAASESAADGPPAPVSSEVGDESSASSEEPSASSEEPSASFDDRRLCADGACIGVIGDDGRCKVCGAADA